MNYGASAGLQDQSLTLSSATSSSATNTFPAISPWLYSLLNDIIHSLSPTASTFDQLFTRYQQVLAERGIDEASVEQDQDAYALLLKLSMQRGVTWAQKWSSAQKAVPPSASPSLDILKARLDTLDARQPPPQPQPSHQPKQSHYVPFVGSRLNARTDYPLTSTPQRPKSAPLSSTRPAGDVLTADEAAAHVTPTKARRVSFVSPRRSATATPSATLTTSNSLATTTPHSHHQLLDSSDDDEDTDEDGRGGGELVLPPHPRRPASTPALSLYRSEQSVDVLPDPHAVAADRFHRANSLATFLDRWRTRTQSVTALQEQTDSLRHTVILKRSMAVWKIRHRYLSDVLQPKADAANALVLSRKYFHLWLFKLKKRQKKQQEQNLSQAVEVAKATFEPRLLEEAWTCWRERLQEVRADKFRSQSLLRLSLGAWSAKSAKVARLANAAAHIVQIKQAEQLYRALETWHRNTALKLAEREVVARHDENLVRQCWQTWLFKRQHAQAADMYSDVRVAKKALGKWSNKVLGVETMGMQAQELDKQRQINSVRTALQSWALQAKVRVFQREKELDVKRTTLHTWLIKSHTVTVDYEARADDFRASQDASLLSRTLSTWRDRITHQRDLESAADASADAGRLSRALRIWRDKAADVALAEKKAVVAREFFLGRRAYVEWAWRLVEKRGAELKERHDLKVKSGVFSTWLQKTRQQRSESVLVDEMSTAIDLRIKQDALSHWLSRVVDLREQQMSVAQERDTKVVALAFARWHRKSQAQALDKATVENIEASKQERHLRSLLLYWRSRATEKAAARERAEEKEQADRAVLLTAVLGKWRSKARKQRGDRLVLTFGKAREHLMVSDGFRKWKNKATLAITADKIADNGALRRTFTTWMSALPRKQDAVEADGHYARTVLGAALRKWRYLWKARVKRRAADRFRPRPLLAARHSLPVQPTLMAESDSDIHMEGRKSEPGNVLQDRLRRRLKQQGQRKSGSSDPLSSRSPTLVEPTAAASVSDATERSPLKERSGRQLGRPSTLMQPPPPSFTSFRHGAAAQPEGASDSLAEEGSSRAPSISSTATSAAAGLTLAEIKARLKHRAVPAVGGRGSSSTARSARPSTPPARPSSTSAATALRSKRQQAAALTPERRGPEFSVDTEGYSSFASSSVL